MYEYFKHIARKNTCRMSGVCSVHPSVNSLLELLLYEIREISNYLVKLNEFKISNPETVCFCVDVLSVFMINTSFNKTKYLKLIQKLYSLKIQAREKYIEYCRENKLPCEILNSNFELKDDMTINELINLSQENILNRQKGCDEQKLGLFEVVTIFTRLCAIDISKIKKLKKDYTKFDFELLRFFALTSGYSIRNEKIKRRIFEFSKIALEIKNKLYFLYQENYGAKNSAKIRTTVKKGHCILVSGDDIDELEKLLKTLNDFKPKEKINVYTNGALFLAHLYPYFKNNKFLKGHFGTDSAEYDFSTFPGSILITRNFIQKIDSLYRGELFSNKLISFDKVFDIQNQDYTPVITSTLKLDGYNKNQDDEFTEISYDKKEILDLAEEIKENKVAIIVGKSDEILKEYNNLPIINLNFSYETDFIFEIIQKLKEKNIEITIFFAQCNLLSLENILILLNSGVNLAIADCPHTFINPHIMNSLREEFNIRII